MSFFASLFKFAISVRVCNVQFSFYIRNFGLKNAAFAAAEVERCETPGVFGREGVPRRGYPDTAVVIGLSARTGTGGEFSIPTRIAIGAKKVIFGKKL